MTDNEVDLDSLEQRRGGRHMVGLEQPQSLEKRSISYLSVAQTYHREHSPTTDLVGA